ncbi:protein-L-histidine (3S)-3-hydroxylase / [histone H3]-trimethyl-L-lysine4/36 demethylase [Marchantia polymorpha subsp. ruderalis]|uniref:Bifunctional lysine-specific demethylase and histidyl-hydroxylase n=2 Tax=Marchantia polymorpha TaxID=3197 RepID=A0A176VMV2_MARPO|nr:hypothetical protein AXG93_3271s1430 [Marchantia polymorpha subsp. ruderalis]PTQ48758.1 hypothetical protein MARPO_0004s0046 [Marchantia polymorpha]BBN05819.1 hypothetical protein Mp_3g16250 [Marchantia polymorpha subsp. ruderalis]|eukprot:PTQ48758.1 hypothetical protein MARPO_0004s0046 [Marchantia polymorpha]
MQAGKRTRFSPSSCSPSVSREAEPERDLGAKGPTSSSSGERKHEREMEQADDRDDDLRMEGCDETNCGEEEDEEAQEASADADDPDDSQVEEEDVDAERLSFLNNFVAEVIEDLRSPDGVEDGLGIVRDPDPSASEQFFQWLIHPLSVGRFHEQFWEKRPFLIRRPRNRSLYEGWFEKEDIETLFERETLKYGMNVDVTKYKDGARANFSTEGAAKANQVWKKFAKGWSVRILHPQRWSNSLFLLLSAFERYWHCVAGCNAYLTPAKSQGFSPHYDDIEAFVLQTEGKKRWRCYRPRSLDDVLPRFSSPDFSQDDIGDPILDEILEPGDLLYMPRGTIHQAEATSDTHSLHITVSVGQRNTWSDYLELALPRALELAWEDHLLLRESLPRDFATYMGVAHSDKDDPRRAAFLERVILCMDRLVKSGPWDSAVDQMAVKFLQARLPLPHVPDSEATKEGGSLIKLNMMSKVRLVAPDVARFVVEEDSAVLYHMLNNSRALHNELSDSCEAGSVPGSSLEFPLDFAPALEELITAYPTPVCVSNLSIDSKQAALDLVTQLYKSGLLVVMK